MAKEETILNLEQQYKKEIVPKLKEILKRENNLSLPKVSKITINAGIGSYVKKHNKDYSNIIENLTSIAGQKPVITKAKKSISNFKLRENDVVGAMVTLRGKKMYDFLNKLINIVFPRVRDFRGLSPKAFDGNGNYSVGFKEHTVFPEISPDDVINLHGLQVNICTTAENNEEALELLKLMKFPFKKTN